MQPDERKGDVGKPGTMEDPTDPQPPGTAYSLSYAPVRGLSLLLFIVAILLCLEGMELGFVTFMILGLVFEVIDFVCGHKHLRMVWGGVDRCVREWKALKVRR